MYLDHSCGLEGTIPGLVGILSRCQDYSHPAVLAAIRFAENSNLYTRFFQDGLNVVGRRNRLFFSQDYGGSSGNSYLGWVD